MTPLTDHRENDKTTKYLSETFPMNHTFPYMNKTVYFSWSFLDNIYLSPPLHPTRKINLEKMNGILARNS